LLDDANDATSGGFTEEIVHATVALEDILVRRSASASLKMFVTAAATGREI